jgi:drug/metabolite transporter (DMT)-like permease
MSRRSWLQLLVLAAAWGAVYPLITVALRELTPVVVVFARVLCAAALLVPLSLRAHALKSLWRRPRAIIETALMQSTIPLLLLTYGQEHITSSLASIIVAAQPLFVTALSYRWDSEDTPRTWHGPAGIILGFTGIVALFGVDLSGGWPVLLGGTLVLTAALCYAIGSLMIHTRHHDKPSLGVATSAMIVTTTALLIPSTFALPDTTPSSGVLTAVLVLGIGCTGMTLVLFYTLIAREGPTRASLAWYLSPAFSVLLGVLFLDEDFSVSTALGLTAIIAGSVVASRRPPASTNRKRSYPTPPRQKSL